MKFQIMDTTLRDGGFAVNFNFSAAEKSGIERALIKAGIDYIEVGYIDSSAEPDCEKTIYPKLADVQCDFKNAVVMMDFGKVSIDDIPDVSESNVTIIRLSFYKEQSKDALSFASRILEKGYKVCLQLMISSEYDIFELDKITERINTTLENIEAVYIVDSFGEMLPETIEKLYVYLDKRLNDDIKIGLHLHNNRMQVYTSLLNISRYDTRNVIIDATLLGIGRGGGNVSTELLVDLMGQCDRYDISVIYDIIDEVIAKKIYNDNASQRHKYIVSAKMHCSPTYVKYYAETYGLTTNQIFELVKYMEQGKKRTFNKVYAEEIYQSKRHDIMLSIIRQSWDEMAERYDTFHPCDEDGRNIFKGIVEKYVKDKGDVLDVGTGTGFLAEICSECGYNTIGIDISNEMIEISRRKAEEKNLNIVYDTFDGINYDFKDKTFDGVVSSRVLWTIIEPEIILNEWYRVLKNDGVIIAFTSIGGEITSEKKRCYGTRIDNSLFFFKYCSEDEIIKCFENIGFKDVKVVYISSSDIGKKRRAGCIIGRK